MFKIKAQLDDEMDRQEVQLGEYAAYMAQCCQERRLRPMHKTGAARLIEYSSELTGRNFKLSLRMAEINDLLQEADSWAGQAESPVIRGEDVEKAVEEKIFRSNLYEEKIQEAIALGDLKIETDGVPDRPGQWLVGLYPGGLFFRPAVADYRQLFPWARRGWSILTGNPNSAEISIPKG